MSANLFGKWSGTHGILAEHLPQFSFWAFLGWQAPEESEAEVLGREQQARNVGLRANTPQAFSLASVEISQQNGLPYWYFGCCIQLFSISLWLWQRNVSNHRSKYCLLAEDLQAQTSHYRPSADSHLSPGSSPGSSSVALPYGEDREDLWDHIFKHCSGDFFWRLRKEQNSLTFHTVT